LLFPLYEKGGPTRKSAVLRCVQTDFSPPQIEQTLVVWFAYTLVLATDMPDEVFKDLRTEGRALGPLACKNYPKEQIPPGIKTRKISMNVTLAG